MDSSFLLSTINPVIGLLLTLTFFLIWRKHPEKLHILNWALGFAAGSIGFGFEFFHFFIANFRFENGVNTLLPLSILFSVRGVCLRYRGHSPDSALLFLVTATTAIAFGMSGGHHYAHLRGLAISCGMAIMMILAMHAMTRAKNWNRIDLCTFLVFSSLAVLLSLRPLASFLMEGAANADTLEVTSFWVVSLKIAGLYAWVVFAILFLLRIAADILNELHEEMVTDSLSGILNRRGFFETASRVIREANPRLPVSLLLLDIDHFKQVNDTYGHQAGDAVIRGVAGVMLEHSPETAVIGRLGGEEFAILIPLSSSRASLAFAEAMRMKIQAQSHPEIHTDYPVTVSIGVAEGKGRALDELMRDADLALYKAKNWGRNQVSVGGEAFRDHAAQIPGQRVRAFS
ncbi:diguanylate cyclase [Hoeflea halophila]|uniref:diguanylate cyclase n=1 Tax=Hoeflea halophila TaxID=714899 RepID=A0A286IEN7_9HYPH|nr:diguanylate cyclase [Hoeflea halophila]